MNHPRAPRHKHPKHKMCVICANVTMHDIQCKAEDECRVVTCKKYAPVEEESVEEREADNRNDQAWLDARGNSCWRDYSQGY